MPFDNIDFRFQKIKLKTEDSPEEGEAEQETKIQTPKERQHIINEACEKYDLKFFKGFSANDAEVIQRNLEAHFANIKDPQER